MHCYRVNIGEIHLLDVFFFLFSVYSRMGSLLWEMTANMK